MAGTKPTAITLDNFDELSDDWRLSPNDGAKIKAAINQLILALSPVGNSELGKGLTIAAGNLDILITGTSGVNIDLGRMDIML